MNPNDRQQRIYELHTRRHALLRRREERGAVIASIDMELNVVRCELQALYAATSQVHPRSEEGQFIRLPDVSCG